MQHESSVEFQKIKNAFQKFGIWSDQPSSRFRWNRYAFFSIFTIFNISGVLGFVNESRTGSLTVVCSNLVVFLLGGYASCSLIVLNKDDFGCWISETNNNLPDMFKNEAYMNSHPNQKIRSIHRRNIKKVWPYFLITLTGWSITVAISVFNVVIFYHIFSLKNHREECSRNQNCRMLFMGYYYFPWDAEEHYWASNMETIVFAIVNCIMNHSKDLIFSCFICYLRCKLMTLSDVIINFDDFLDCVDESVRYKDKVGLILRECAIEHQEILLKFRELKEFLSVLFFFMLVSHAPVLVNTALILWQGERLTPFAICIYCGTVYGCGHLFLILWLSEHLSIESVQLAESIYFSKWYELDVKEQKMLLLMLSRAQNPVVLSCGALCSASLSTFMKTMKTIYTMLNAIASIAK
ncbi:odorant receptor 67d-like [Coccinella septempunctata]|uniref:odorant receptor 67d-like n=1 Tax=Coccinella septempunctata TaxID=41139 RepID=UPI001D068BB1|nr:odorant receptor 67d-like [Coccinella septempunctata]